jgi:hypothetical protein
VGRPVGLRKINGKWVQTGSAVGPVSFAAQQAQGILSGPLAVKDTETEEQRDHRIRGRFGIAELMTKDCIEGKCRCLVISGPGGMSKSFLVERLVRAADPDKTRSVIRRGYATKTGLYKTLLEFKGKKNVVVFDDCDSVFKDEEALNILKVAADTSEERVIYYGAETNMTDEQGGPIPTTFNFEGSLIFLTNYDMEEACDRGTGLAVHFNAIMDRSKYISMGLKTVQDYLTRIKQVVFEDGMLKDLGYTDSEAKEIFGFIESNSVPVYKFRQLTMRTVKKVAQDYRNHKHNWQQISAVTLFRNGFDL